MRSLFLTVVLVLALLLAVSEATPSPTCPSHVSKCSITCFFNGECDEETGACLCKEGWTGPSCGEPTCDASVCSPSGGQCCASGCCCHIGWTGARCDKFVGMLPYRGPVCTVDGTCSCSDTGAPCPEGTGVDLVPLTGQIFTEWVNFGECHCALETGCITQAGMRRLLRFDTYSYNRGNADLFIGFPGSHPERYTWHVCHGHPHFRHWASFELRDLHSGAVLLGTKAGSTILDSVRKAGRLSYRYTQATQGVTAGWADWYPYYFDCQWIDITDLPPSQYQLVFRSNPSRLIAETDYTNNELVVPLNCPASCSGHGDCDFGKCVCHEGWSGATCSVASQCTPNCQGRSCGSNGCGGTCGTCSSFERCEPNTGLCSCNPQCTNKDCGYDGCGDQTGCGLCPGEFDRCINFRCVCTPSCAGKQCGDDGCGGTCGSPCGADKICQSGRCVACRPQCAGRQCGSNGCGGECGVCSAAQQCDATGHCACRPDCVHAQCGDDSCGGECGACIAGAQLCADKSCVQDSSQPDLLSTCQDDSCDDSLFCLNGWKCVDNASPPDHRAAQLSFDVPLNAPLEPTPDSMAAAVAAITGIPVGAIQVASFDHTSVVHYEVLIYIYSGAQYKAIDVLTFLAAPATAALISDRYGVVNLVVNVGG